MGTGCVVQGLGFAAPVALFFLLGPFGVVLGLVLCLVLFVYGSRLANFWACGACGTKLVDDSVTTCPACRATLT
jgi:hypothetical protein